MDFNKIKTKRFDVVTEDNDVETASPDNSALGDILRKASGVDLPDVVDASDIQWPVRMVKRSIYSKYDTMEVGKAVQGLESAQASSISQRLKKRGFKMKSSKLADGTFVVVRVA